jgi:hypothetical protein
VCVFVAVCESLLCGVRMCPKTGDNRYPGTHKPGNPGGIFCAAKNRTLPTWGSTKMSSYHFTKSYSTYCAPVPVYCRPPQRVRGTICWER